MDDLARDEIEYALRLARSRGFTSVKLKKGETSFSATLGESAFEEEPSASDDVAAPKDVAVKAPAVGYFRVGTKPVAVGDLVEAGSTVGEVVALGIANEVTTSASGTVKEILVANGDAVEFGQALMTLETS